MNWLVETSWDPTTHFEFQSQKCWALWMSGCTFQALVSGNCIFSESGLLFGGQGLWNIERLVHGILQEFQKTIWDSKLDLWNGNGGVGVVRDRHWRIGITEVREEKGECQEWIFRSEFVHLSGGLGLEEWGWRSGIGGVGVQEWQGISGSGGVRL